MHLAHSRLNGETVPVVNRDGQWSDLRPLTAAIGPAHVTPEFLTSLRTADLPTIAEPTEYGPPLTGIGKIVCIGLNYADHAAETGREQPQAPIVFTKLPTSSVPPNDELHLPAVIRRLDYEGELAVVMGAGGEVAGYAVADDVSARDLQGREPQWTRAKGAATFCPWGPWIVTADEVLDPAALRVRTWVNGELRQDAPTSELLFGVAELVAFLSETQALEPGDLVLTGTPSGVGFAMDPPRYLEDGDVVRVEVEGVGAIEHPIEVSASR
jgi:acylpyruvate hydrolase